MSKYNFEQKRNDYLSPPELVDMALKYLKIQEFDLDVCCSKTNIPAKKHFIDGTNNGLNEDWEKYNWCNPPYDVADAWVEKAYKEQQKGNFTAMLIPARTETKYWHDYILDKKKVKIKWLRKGYRFIDPDTGEYMGIYKNALAIVYFKGEKPKVQKDSRYIQVGLFKDEEIKKM